MKILGLIGLGEKGYDLAQQLQARKIKILGFDLNDTNRLKAANNRIVTTSSISGVVMHLPQKKIICMAFLSEADKRKTLIRLNELLKDDDILIDLVDDDLELEYELYKPLIYNGVKILDAKYIEGQIAFDMKEIHPADYEEVCFLC